MAYFATQLGIRPDFLGRWLPGMLILGVGAGLTFPTLSGAAVGSVPGPRFAVATALNSVSRQLGAALGVAVLIAIIGTPTPLQALHAFEHGWLLRRRLLSSLERLPAWRSWSSAAEQAAVVHRRAAFRGRRRRAVDADDEPSPHLRTWPSRRVGRRARGGGAADGRRVPAQRPGVRRDCPRRCAQEIAALARDVSIGRRRVAVSRRRSRRRRVCRARRTPRGGPARVEESETDQHAHARRGARRARAAQRLRCAAPRCARCATPSC